MKCSRIIQTDLDTSWLLAASGEYHVTADTAAQGLFASRLVIGGFRGYYLPLDMSHDA
jgi:hypothetical protein